MRSLSAMLALVLVLSGMLMPCPACEQAEVRQLPPDAHACCTKGIPAESTAPAHSPSDSTDSSDGEPAGQECLRFAVTRALASLKSDQVAPASDVRLMDIPTSSAVSVLATDWVTGAADSSWLAGLHGPPDALAHGPTPGTAPTPLRL
ncbi:MAG: hypothetical protein KIT83_14215 [Bryobacterales bacterium]|nr:hypothetical protein [Bryobacterales bacterium]